MTRPSFRSALAAGVAVLSLTFATVQPARAIIVFDPSNFAENVMQAARALEQIQNQITSLQNEAQMLADQARNLMNLDYSSLAAIDNAQTRIADLLDQANRIAYDVQAIETAFSERYGAANLNVSDIELINNAQERWKDASEAFHHAMTVQAGAVDNLPAVRSETNALVTRSQSAVGILQAAQAGNQLLGVQAAQLADLTAVIAADGRARALADAGRAAAEAQAREQYRRFLTDAQGYQPATVRMFHQ